MQININAVHFKADKQLESFIIDKLRKVGKFYENIIGGEVTLKVENTEKPENKTAEIRLKIKGNDLISIKHCKTFEEATDSAIEALRKQLEKSIKKDKKRKNVPETKLPEIVPDEPEDFLEELEEAEDILSE